MNRVLVVPLPIRAAALAAIVALAGCSSIENFLGGDKIDYRSQSGKTNSLEVPPDLTQLARDARYQPQTGVVSANALQQQANATPTASTAAPTAIGDVRVERQGNQRWLVTSQPPEKVWPVLRSFWQERGFNLTADNAEVGVMETDWALNRAKLPQDLVRRTIGSVLDNLYDTGERDRFRTRVERTPAGTEIYISHRGMVEVFAADLKDRTIWQPRPSDPDLEAELLTRLMARLGTREEVAKTAVAAAATQPARARTLSGKPGAALEVDEAFDRAWRRVGLALDRSGFTVEDRDRSAGLYFVRYVDPKLAGQDEPNFLSKLFGWGKDKEAKVDRYRVAVKGAGAKTEVSVLNSQGNAEAGEAGKQIVTRLVDELR